MSLCTTPRDRTYLTLNFPGATPGSKTSLTGIRGNKNVLYISGFYGSSNDSDPIITFVYKGDIKQRLNPSRWHILNYPSEPGRTVKTTNLYGPDILKHDNIRVVGNYITTESSALFGCLYEGKLDGSGVWTTITPSPDTSNTIVHSTNGELAVGNYSIPISDGTLAHAFIYDVITKTFTEIIKPDATSITAYGIWHNGCDNYTICGGFSNVDPNDPTVTRIDSGYLVDYNRTTHVFSNWRAYNYKGNDQVAVITHFDGITSDGTGGYNLCGDALTISGSPLAFAANVKRKCNGKFSRASWEEIKFPGSQGTSGNSVYLDSVIGVYTNPNDTTVNGYISAKP